MASPCPQLKRWVIFISNELDASIFVKGKRLSSSLVVIVNFSKRYKEFILKKVEALGNERIHYMYDYSLWGDYSWNLVNAKQLKNSLVMNPYLAFEVITTH